MLRGRFTGKGEVKQALGGLLLNDSSFNIPIYDLPTTKKGLCKVTANVHYMHTNGRKRVCKVTVPGRYQAGVTSYDCWEAASYEPSTIRLV